MAAGNCYKIQQPSRTSVREAESELDKISATMQRKPGLSIDQRIRLLLLLLYNAMATDELVQTTYTLCYAALAV